MAEELNVHLVSPSILRCGMECAIDLAREVTIFALLLQFTIYHDDNCRERIQILSPFPPTTIAIAFRIEKNFR
jgi:hypothetical protein